MLFSILNKRNQRSTVVILKSKEMCIFNEIRFDFIYMFYDLGIIIALIILAVGFQLSVIHTPPVPINETSINSNDICVRYR